MTDKFWMIVDVQHTNATWRGTFLDQKKAPRFIHPDKSQAEIELMRLQRLHPDGDFVLLEAVAVAQQKMVMVVEPIEADDGIPF